MSARRTKRLNAVFTEEAHSEIARLAESRNKTITALLEDAISLEKWYQRTIEEGGRVVAEYEDGRRYEVVRP